MSNKLKPCPFCGGKPWLREKVLRYYGVIYLTGEKKTRYAMYYYCGRCKARGGVATGTFFYKNYLSASDRSYLKHCAIDAWNRRSTDE